MYMLGKSSLPESVRNAMENKMILVVGEEVILWKQNRTTLHNYGIKIILVESKPISFPPEDVHRYIQYNFTDHRHDDLHAERIIAKLSADNILVDGCCTFTDEHGPLTAYLCQKLGLNGAGVTGAINARIKSLTHIYLQKQVGGVHQFPRTNRYTARCAPIVGEASLRSAIRAIGLPAICKPENYENANGVMLIKNIAEYPRLIQSLRNLLENRNPLMMMEYFDGTEHDIEVILYQGEVLAAIVSDNGPTRPESFLETSMSMPSCLPTSKAAQLRRAASDCCIDIGLMNGVFNVEMKITPAGPKLLEINGRMGGDYIRDWVYTCFGFDLMWYVMAISAGMRPPIPNQKPNAHVMGITCSWPVHQHIICNKDFGIKVGELVKSNDIIFFGEKCIDVKENHSKEPFDICNVAVIKQDLESAKTALLNVCDLLGIHNEQFDVPACLSHFVTDAPSEVDDLLYNSFSSSSL
ncbi:carnosine synthase 1-like [Argopecten irradians]|uniref:carnosine synthase 1-like n=1 Tax=Argopecten irradians TaxID=31199 RepID=UPI003719D73B